MMPTRLAVFCGSRKGTNPRFEKEARIVANALADHGIGMVYGGGSVGIMGILADELIARQGEVIGVIPKKLMDMEVGHTGVTQLHIVDTMHQRKAMMAELSDGFLALPGGIGTIEEIVEVFTWLQLGYHQKPCGLLNTLDYYDYFLKLLDHMVYEGFLDKTTKSNLLIESNIQSMLRRMNLSQS